MSGTQVSAVILAGGRSVRFGSDKLTESVEGRPLLHHAIDGVRPLASDIIVVAAPGGAPSLPDDVRLVHDPVAFEGPLAGLLVGLRAAHEPIVVVVGGDMPTLVEGVLVAMVSGLGAPGIDAVVLEHDGRARPLPLVLHRLIALDATAWLLGSGERRLRALTETVATRIIADTTWRADDPDARTIRDIDTRADLG